MVAICVECRAVLTDEEERYYSCRCEQCERDWSDRIKAWRHGAEDADLDRAYGEDRKLAS